MSDPSTTASSSSASRKANRRSAGYTAKEKPQQGKVIAAGIGKVKDDGTRQQPDVKAGDLILFGKYSGQEVKLDGEEYIIMREDDVLGVIEGADAKNKK